MNSPHFSSGDDILFDISSIITSDQNEMLTKFPSLDEVYNTVKGMNGNSVGGPDGYNGFFKACWHIIKEDFYSVVCEFFAGFELPKSWTSTLIVPIPKVPAPQILLNSRP